MTEPTEGLDVKPLFIESKSLKPNRLASLPVRFLAFWIDLMIVALFTEALTFASMLISGSSTGGVLLHPSLLAFALFFFNIFLLAYFIWFYTMEGKTLGKMVLGIKVIDYNNGNIGFFRSTVRAFGYYLSSFFFAGFFWAVFDDNAEGWHDKLAGTVVVYDDR